MEVGEAAVVEGEDALSASTRRGQTDATLVTHLESTKASDETVKDRSSAAALATCAPSDGGPAEVTSSRSRRRRRRSSTSHTAHHADTALELYSIDSHIERDMVVMRSQDGASSSGAPSKCGAGRPGQAAFVATAPGTIRGHRLRSRSPRRDGSSRRVKSTHEHVAEVTERAQTTSEAELATVAEDGHQGRWVSCSLYPPLAPRPIGSSCSRLHDFAPVDFLGDAPDAPPAPGRHNEEEDDALRT